MIIKLYVALALAGLIAMGVGYHGCKRSWQREQELKAVKEVQRQTEEVQREQEKRREKVERMPPSELLDYWRGVQHGGSGSGPAPAPKEAKP